MPAPIDEAGQPRDGACILMFAFDIGQGIDLERARQAVGRGSEPQRFRHAIHAPSYFQFQPAPLRLAQSGTLRMPDRPALEATVDLLLYDFGAVSVSYTLRWRGSWSEWIDLGCTLGEQPAWAADARTRVEELARAIGPCIHKFGMPDVVEDYMLFEFDWAPQAAGLERILLEHGDSLARLLRAERSPLSQQEVSDALGTRVSFGPGDLALVDWNSSILFDDAPADVRAVLEFANVQLLELRFLDRQLDSSLDQAFESLGRRGWRRVWRPAAFEHDLDQVSRLQVDAAILFERVGNALKLLGDQYLARVYRQASQRFRLGEWNASILRKLDTLDGIYQKIQDRADARRMEFLEWIIIVLILVSTVLPFVLH